MTVLEPLLIGVISPLRIALGLLPGLGAGIVVLVWLLSG